MTHSSTSDLLALHAVRLRGFVDSPGAADRFGLDPTVVDEHLLDAQARGWVSWSAFAGTGGWSLTDAGRRADEAALAQELDHVAGRLTVQAVHDDFLPLNTLLSTAATRWQLRPTEDDPFAANTHDDASWDVGVLADLGRVEAGLRDLGPRLAAVLDRFAGYDDRFTTAVERAVREPEYVTGVGVDSCHAVWFELHEDLLATLGLPR
jgi:hypothetical protein